MDLLIAGVLALVALVAIGFWFKSRTSASAMSLDAMMQEASDAFASHRLDQPAFDAAFSGANLDYSVESLKQVDEGLERLRNDLPQNSDGTRDLGKVEDKGLMRLVSGAGAYLGEVIKRNSSQQFEWKSFEDLPEDARDVFGGQKDMSNFVVLARVEGRNHSLPMNRIGRFLINGSEDSVYAFARSVMKGDGD